MANYTQDEKGRYSVKYTDIEKKIIYKSTVDQSGLEPDKESVQEEILFNPELASNIENIVAHYLYLRDYFNNSSSRSDLKQGLNLAKTGLDEAKESIGDFPQFKDMQEYINQILSQPDNGGRDVNSARNYLIGHLSDIWSHYTGKSASNSTANFRKFIKAICKPLSSHRKPIDEFEISDSGWQKAITRALNQ